MPQDPADDGDVLDERDEAQAAAAAARTRQHIEAERAPHQIRPALAGVGDPAGRRCKPDQISTRDARPLKFLSQPLSNP